MKKILMTLALYTLFCMPAPSALAHFGMIIADRPVVTQDSRKMQLTLSFSHPFAGHGMDQLKPRVFDVYFDGKTRSLLGDLEPARVMDHQAWQTMFTPKRPGVYQFVMEPQPYWEPAEDLSIIHYTKTVACAFGDEEGWDRELGLKTEIVPLSRPFGGYAGYSFTGQVKMNGQPVPGAEVEVEYYDRDKAYEAPSDVHVTYVVKADPNGIFTFACPRPGWWGFAALNKGDFTLTDPQGNEKDVELGAVLWIELAPWTKNGDHSRE